MLARTWQSRLVARAQRRMVAVWISITGQGVWTCARSDWSAVIPSAGRKRTARVVARSVEALDGTRCCLKIAQHDEAMQSRQ